MNRLKMGMTQDKLAKKLGISRGCLANYEAGLRYPDRNTLSRLAKYFNVSIEHLTGRTGIFSTLKEEELIVYEQRKRETESYGNTINLNEIDFFSRIEIVDYFNYLMEKSNRNKDRHI
ncbi:MAG: helix-turn-helix transcriptional regulator [Clostridia bacterium]|nr:helix-turn-helix transcriptional regulator [Clostridia bacterium]